MKSVLGLLLVLACALPASTQAQSLPITARIVGGIDTPNSAAPFIVSLRFRGQHYCGGTLVSDQWVVTAAHCVEDITPDEIVAGTDRISDVSSAKRFAVSAVIIHPNYSRSQAMSTDVAMIKLKTKSSLPFAWLNRTSPRSMSVKEFTTAGWGDLSEGGTAPDVLQSVKLPVVAQSECERQLQAVSPSSTPHLDNTMFCAGLPKGGQDSCQGDSGGPMFYQNQLTKKYILVGVVSWGFGCARPNLSGIYSDVAASYKWILGNINRK